MKPVRKSRKNIKKADFIRVSVLSVSARYPCGNQRVMELRGIESMNLSTNFRGERQTNDKQPELFGVFFFFYRVIPELIDSFTPLFRRGYGIIQRHGSRFMPHQIADHCRIRSASVQIGTE